MVAHAVYDALGQIGWWHSAEVLVFATPYVQPLSGQLSEPAAGIGTLARAPQSPVAAWMLQQSLRASSMWLRTKPSFRFL